MKTDVEVSVTGLDFDSAAVSGVTIMYGVDMVPVAQLSLNAPMIQETNPAFLCNPDKYKNRDNEVVITIKSKTGCIKFTGFFEGLSIAQSVGNFQYTAIIKSKFQRLMEIYPRFLGIMPGSSLPFTMNEQYRSQQGNENQIITSFNIAKQLIADTSKTVGEYMVEYLKLLVKSQFNYINLVKTEEKIQRLYNIMRDESYNRNVQKGIPLLENVDVTYIKDCEIRAGICAENMASLTMGDHDSLWGLMQNVFDFMCCSLICANDKLFIVPKASFLKLEHSVPGFQTPASEPNTANPVDYNAFNLSDNGLINIKYCFVEIDPGMLPSTATDNYRANITAGLGAYPPEGGDPELTEDGATGVHIVKASPFFLNGLAYSLASNPEVQADIAAGLPYATTRVDTPEETQKRIEKINTTGESTTERQQRLLDQYAKLQFMKMKYTDRVGSFSSVFNPKWVPGTTGSLYTRTPGLFVQFYVQTVSHHIAVNAPNNGTATTTVNFSSGRTGKQGQIPGVRQDDLYKYNTDKMKQLQNAWIANIKG